MKDLAKQFITRLLGWQVRRLRRRNNIRVVAVVGSIGKTSTKLAIAQMLSKRYRVRYQDGNYNVPLSVPLIFFGHNMPPLLNPLAWLKILISNEKQLLNKYPYDIVVVELGTAGPGQLAPFKKYLQIDVAVLTAIAQEHMEFFKDLDAVAREETVVQSFSRVVLANADLCAPEYLSFANKSLFTYGTKGSDYMLETSRISADGSDFFIYHDRKTLIHAKHPSIALPQLYSLAAAVAVGHRFKLTKDQLEHGVTAIKPVDGRLRQLAGVNDSVIIDDTYNSSPEAVKFSLEVLYSLPAPHKVAILGSMNELGRYSKKAHEEIGEYCEPKHIDLLVTIGREANIYLASAAEKRGCVVQRFDNPYEAGLYVKERLRPKALVLAKGSQNGVFAEEAVKQLLVNPKDEQHLVRQSKAWLTKKHRQFGLWS